MPSPPYLSFRATSSTSASIRTGPKPPELEPEQNIPHFIHRVVHAAPSPLHFPSKNQVKQSAKPLSPLHLSPSNLQILIFFHTLVQTASDDDLNAKYQRCYCAAGAGQCKRQMGQGSLGTGMCSPAAPQGRLLAQKVQRTLPAHPQVKTH